MRLMWFNPGAFARLGRSGRPSVTATDKLAPSQVVHTMRDEDGALRFLAGRESQADAREAKVVKFDSLDRHVLAHAVATDRAAGSPSFAPRYLMFHSPRRPC